MSKSYRIRTTPGRDNGYLKVNVDLNQNYDFLELLSLKISQKNDYQSFCADYGVVAGRVIVNGGFGVPNVKVSIFVPVSDEDLENPVISEIYNYTEPFSDQKNGNDIRYNLLPKNQQSLEHTPVGTFPKKREILDDKTTLEIYEKYYKYTTTTNEAGDYIIFGVPVGEQFLHYDMDVSDIGFISTRPFELINRGYSDDLFASRFKYDSSNDLDSLPQIFSGNIPVTVEPYWCDSLSTGSALGINRLDIEPDVEIIPTSVFMGSVFSDDEKDSINKNCKPDRQMGKMNEVITSSGKIEAIRRTVEGSIEKYDLKEESIDENGNWSVLIPMNLRKVVTDEFGNLVPSPDGVKGIATEGDYRFRISMDATSNDKRLRQRAKFLVPNTNNNFVFKEYSQNDLKNSTDFTLNEELSTITDNTPFENDITNQYNYLEEFFPFRWKKIYTVKQYIGRFQKSNSDEARGFIGIKDILNSEGVNKFPSNRHDGNFNILYTIICLLLGVFATIVGIINGLINNLNGIVTRLCQVRLPIGLCFGSSTKGSRYKLSYEKSDFFNGAFPSSFISGYSPVYDKGLDFTGTNNDKDPGDFDGFLGNCNDTREYYPAKTDDVTGITQPVDENGNNFGVGSLAPPGLSVSDFLDSNGLSTGGWIPSPDNNKYYRLAISQGDSWRDAITNCDKQPLPDQGCDGIRIFGYCIQFKYICIFGGIFCRWCGGQCPGSDKHSCCPGGYNYGCDTFASVCGGLLTSKCCIDCCVLIPQIPLRCAETGETWIISYIASFFSPLLCNSTLVLPFSCVSCGGLSTPGVKDWLSCNLEGLAVYLKMLKFDFYNDWVGGTLYFPLVKRKYKIRKAKKRLGQIKKDKFCDFDCDDFQSPGITQWRIVVIPSTNSNVSSTITVQGCTAIIKTISASEWYGSEDIPNQTDNLNLAVKDLIFEGKTNTLNDCKIKFKTYADFQTVIPLGLHQIKSKTLPGEHDKPEYILTESPDGSSTWENVGGHGHHRNTCDNTRLMERKEYFKTTLDCDDGQINPSEVPEDGSIIEVPQPDDDVEFNDDDETNLSSYQIILDNAGCPDTNNCNSKCGFNGVKPCSNIPSEYEDYKKIIRHGLVTWEEGEIYYTAYIPIGDTKENNDEYKANLILPTTIMELGSMTFCDIDNTPFIINQVPPTTFKVSTEDFKAKLGNQNGDTIPINKLKDNKDSSLNLSAYIEISCFSTVCVNTSGIANQSQLGVEIIDKNDIGIQTGSCFLRFEHDEELREYFCKRFSGYKSDRSFHHFRPGGTDTDNEYNTYPEITLVDYVNSNLFYQFPQDEGGATVLSEYNDTDPFIPGDACGYKDSVGNPDYFYGLAPGSTQNFINYPNGSQTINFGSTPFTEEVTADNINFNTANVSGIRFNRSQTPYYLYFGIVPGKTALHKTVGKFFADKINAVTLQGVGPSNGKVDETINNSPGINGGEENKFTIYKTCLGDNLIDTQVPNQ